MLSKSAEYALRVVLQMARLGRADPVRASDLARELRVPANYLSKILYLLARAGILVSERGRRGGFRLAVPVDALPLAAVVEPFDGPLDRRDCLLGRPECSDGSPCAAHERWKRVRDEVSRFFRETTVADLAASLQPGGRAAGGVGRSQP
jgi:Rrf2 family iron-sulfur cluster assembly transcriptional regulator